MRGERAASFVFSEFLTRYSCWCPQFHTVWHRKDRSQSCGRHSLLRVMKCSSEHYVTCECHIEESGGGGAGAGGGGGGRAVAKKLPGLPARSGSRLGRSILSFAKNLPQLCANQPASRRPSQRSKTEEVSSHSRKSRKSDTSPKKEDSNDEAWQYIVVHFEAYASSTHHTQTCCRRRKKLARHPVCSSARGKRSSNTRCGEFIGLIPPRKEAQERQKETQVFNQSSGGLSPTQIASCRMRR